MKHFSTPNIIYLEDSEFDTNFNLRSPHINPSTGRPYFSGVTVVLVQGTYCGYCNEMKPIFQQLANEISPNVEFATIQIDGKQPGEKIFQGPQLENILGKPLQGVPLILRFYNGRPIDEYSGDRSYESLKQYIIN